MSLEAILAAIAAAGAESAAQVRAEGETHAREILAAAEPLAAARHAAARAEALQPAGGERARLLHRARLEALGLVAAARDGHVAAALAALEQRLASLRTARDYPLVLRRLTEEALAALDVAPGDREPPQLMVDPRDRDLLERSLHDLGLPLAVEPALETWGGLVAHSADGRIVVNNTLEARLERALPFLRRDLAAFFERVSEPKNQPESQPACPTSTTATPASTP